MIVDDANTIVNYNRYHMRDIHKTVRELSLEQKQKLLDEIQLQKATHSLMGREYNHHNCERIEKLLAKESK